MFAIRRYEAEREARSGALVLPTIQFLSAPIVTLRLDWPAGLPASAYVLGQEGVNRGRATVTVHGSRPSRRRRRTLAGTTLVSSRREPESSTFRSRLRRTWKSAF
jgi:hypothetical protein